MSKASARADYERRYRVTLCTKCHHPGGQHRMAWKGRPPYCALCECNGWDEAMTADGWWSHAMTDEARAVLRAVLRAGR